MMYNGIAPQARVETKRERLGKPYAEVHQL